MGSSIVSIFGIVLFSLAPVCATARQDEQFPPELQEFRKNGTRDPLRNIQVLQMLPKSATHARIQTRAYDFKEARRQMEYELYVPTKYNASRPAPLMVTLHGLAVQPRDQIRFGYLPELAEERGYIVVAPMGYNNHGGYGVRGTPVTGRGAAGRGADQQLHFGRLLDGPLDGRWRDMALRGEISRVMGGARPGGALPFTQVLTSLRRSRKPPSLSCKATTIHS